MTLKIAFWDSSVLVALCVTQQTSAQAKSWADQFGMMVWWAAQTEVESAIARLHRTSQVSSSARLIALDRLAVLREDWDEISPDDAVRNLAGTLLETYPLSAADSFQLAAALLWCRNRPKGRTFLSADNRLAEAATHAGFNVLRP